MIYKIDALLDVVVGKELDSGTMELIFDVSEWQKDYPDLKDYRVEVSAPNGIVYIPANVKLEGSNLIWPITNADTAISGKGKFQIVATGEYEQRKTSDTRNLYIGKIIDGTGAADPPDPARPWVEEVLDAARRAEEAAERAEAAGGGGGQSPGIPANITINGEGPDENGNFVINTLDDVEIAQLSAMLT